ncbi:GTP-binding protein [Micromonospora sp. NPDC000207]|uniref:GTP-binding protein n=1 Tax=Micromonospora sp. NPDC000207 TaxID=3154246 RepID=UPI00332769BA
MAQRSQDEGVGTDVPVVTEPGGIRNVVLVGRSGVGKTALVEALVAATDATGRGAAVPADTPAVADRGRSVALSAVPLRHAGVKVNLLDTPGYADFVAGLRAGLRAADAALFVVSAADGLDPATVALWEECAAVDLPRSVVVSRLDDPRADFDEAVALCQRLFGDTVVAVHLPMLGDDGELVAGLLGLLTDRVYDYSAGLPAAVRDPDPEHLTAIAEARDELVEAILAESENDSLLDRYVAGLDVPPPVLAAELDRAVSRGYLHPVVPVCAATGVGLDLLLDGLVDAFPAPSQRELPVVTGRDGSPRPPLDCDPDGPLVAEVLQTTVEAGQGRVGLVRVFSGTLRPGQPVHLARAGAPGADDPDVRLADLRSPSGTPGGAVPLAVAGDVVAVTGWDGVTTGDTISDVREPLALVPWELPEPLLPVAVVAAADGDTDAVAHEVGRLVDADPTLRLTHDPGTRQLVLWCVGEAQAQEVLDRVRAGGVEVGTEPVRVALVDGAGQALREPVDEVLAGVPGHTVGRVLGDLSARRGRVLGTEPDPEAEGLTLVRAEVPAVELLRYGPALRDLTAGAGTFGRRFVRHEPVPDHLTEQLRAEHTVQR